MPVSALTPSHNSANPAAESALANNNALRGDTSPEGLDNFPPVYDAKVLITEMSFIRPNHRREKIHKFGHMHLDDFIEREERFKNELIIAAHFSTRYHPQEVRQYLEAKLPPGLRGRVKLWL